MARVAESGTVVFVETDEPARAVPTKLWPSRQYPEEERRYSWLEDYLARLEGKEARRKYYALLAHA